jgi:hypothetical protein
VLGVGAPAPVRKERLEGLEGQEGQEKAGGAGRDRAYG